MRQQSNISPQLRFHHQPATAVKTPHQPATAVPTPARKCGDNPPSARNCGNNPPPARNCGDNPTPARKCGDRTPAAPKPFTPSFCEAIQKRHPTREQQDQAHPPSQNHDRHLRHANRNRPPRRRLAPAQKSKSKKSRSTNESTAGAPKRSTSNTQTFRWRRSTGALTFYYENQTELDVHIEQGLRDAAELASQVSGPVLRQRLTERKRRR